MITVTITDIRWDLSEFTQTEKREILKSLPKTVEYDVDEDTDIDLEAADWLSDDYGYLVEDFAYTTDFDEQYM